MSGLFPIVTKGLGIVFVYSESLDPKPPDKITTFILNLSFIFLNLGIDYIKLK